VTYQPGGLISPPVRIYTPMTEDEGMDDDGQHSDAYAQALALDAMRERELAAEEAREVAEEAEEDKAPTCECGYTREWVLCEHCGGDGFVEHEPDNEEPWPGWEDCPECGCKGGWWVCPNTPTFHDAEVAKKQQRTRVVNIKCKEPFDVYIGRRVRYRPDLTPLGWGNPFTAWNTPARFETPIEAYAEWIQRQPRLLALLPEIRGKVLGCWCAPKGGLPGNMHGETCHGEILAALADALSESAP
jgi:hypothetical protein